MIKNNDGSFFHVLIKLILHKCQDNLTSKMCQSQTVFMYLSVHTVCVYYALCILPSKKRKNLIFTNSCVTHSTLHHCVISSSCVCVCGFQFAVVSDSCSSLIPTQCRVVGRRELPLLHTHQADYLSTGLNTWTQPQFPSVSVSTCVCCTVCMGMSAWDSIICDNLILSVSQSLSLFFLDMNTVIQSKSHPDIYLLVY